MAAKNFKPGHFYRLQNFESYAPLVDKTRLLSEGVALIGTKVSQEEGILSFIILEKGTSTRLFATFKKDDPISIMGPTGARVKIPHDKETLLIIGGQMASAHLRAIGPELRKAGNRVFFIGLFDTAREVLFKEELEAAADFIYWITKNGDSIESIRQQDQSATGDFISLLMTYVENSLSNKDLLSLAEVNRIHIIGTHRLVKLWQSARNTFFNNYLNPNATVIASIYGPMQCMLKGVCAQCLQWQIDSNTGKRTKAVFACSWQDQPLDIVDLKNLDERLEQNQMQEILSNLWLDYLLANYNVSKI